MNPFPLARALIRLCLVLALGALASSGSASPPPAPEHWFLRWGDSPRSQDTFSWLSSPQQHWQPTASLTAHRPPRQEFLWLRTRVPVSLPHDGAMLVRYVDQACEIFLDGKTIARQGHLNGQKFHFQGYTWFIVPLPPDSAGKELFFRIRSTHVNIGLASPVFDSRDRLIRRVCELGLPELAGAITLLLLATILLVAWVFARKKHEYVALAAALGLSSIYLLARSEYRVFLYGNPHFWVTLDVYSLLFASAFFPVSHELIFGKGLFSSTRFVSILFWSTALVCVVLNASGLVTVMQLLLPTQMCIMLWIIVAVGNSIVLLLRNDRDARIFLAGFIMACAMFAAQILGQLRVIPLSSQSVATLGFLAFAMSLIAILVRRLILAYSLLHQYTEDLQEKNERRAKLDKMKDEFLSNTSHELRTPLNGIIGIAESLAAGASGSVGPRMQKNLELIMVSARRLVNLVNDILDFSKMQNRNLELSLTPVDLHSMGELVVTLARPLLGSKPVELRNEVPVGLPPVSADEARLHQILQNLLGNAVKFTHSGFVALTAIPQGDRVRVEVRDTGIGIAPEHFERIFESFEQADGSVSRLYGGTGLGLAITKRLVQAHGGLIGVESEPGKGSTFWFSLQFANHREAPLLNHDPSCVSSELLSSRLVESSSGEDVLQVRATPDSTPAHGPRHRILAVDDDPINLQVLTNYLVLEHRYEVTAISDPDEALALFEAQDSLAFDLVLLDVMMPGLSGFELCKRIRARFNSNQVPIVLLTAKAQAEDLMQGFELGANDYLVKPFSRTELVARMRNHILLKELSVAMALSRSQQARLEKDLEAARAVQHHLLPENLTFPNLAISVHYQSADQTGGDWYGGFHEPRSGYVYFFVGDVTGHGVPAALITGLAAGAISSFFAAASDHSAEAMDVTLRRIAAVANAVVYDSGHRSGHQMTMAMFAIDLTKGESVYLNAGHPPPLQIRGNQTIPLMQRGNPLGMKRSQEFQTKSFELQQGDHILVFTDGLTENSGPDGRTLSTRDLRRLASAGHDSAESISKAILNAAKAVWQDERCADDVTLVVLQRT